MLRLVLGEYAGDHGFLLPNPSCFMSGISAIKISDSVTHNDFKK